MSARSRIWQHAETVEGQQETISLLFELPFNATLLQWSIAFSDIPSATEFLTITKISRLGSQYDVTIAEYCPQTDQLAEYLCNPKTEFMKGDSVEVIYANTDDLTIGVELCFTEGE